MRPSDLNPLFATVEGLKGIGPKTAPLFARLLSRPAPDRARIRDLLFHLPTAVIDRRARPGVANARDGSVVTLDLVVEHHEVPPQGRRNAPYRVHCRDETGRISLVFFHPHQKWIEARLPVDQSVVVSGTIDRFHGQASMVHPDYIVAQADAGAIPAVEPVYPLVAGLSGKLVSNAIAAALNKLPALPEWLDPAMVKRESFEAFGMALREIHRPREVDAVDPMGAFMRRLAYDELLAGQLSLALVRNSIRRLPGRSISARGDLRRRIEKALPYSLTASQISAIDAVTADMAGEERMLRLLQGDVGAGKTIVAFLAMATAAEAGSQAVMMAPTEVLARQHFQTIAPMAEAVGLKAVILTGRDKGKVRQAALDAIADGTAKIIIGTHALFQDGIDYHDLGLAVVDEQHRFGVHQRLRLTAKGTAPHMLVMTATPIPRTLVLSAFGDMDVSRLREKPAGRQPVQTSALPQDRLGALMDRLQGAIADDQKVYWICPLIEESDELPLVSVEERFESLQKRFADAVGLVHGRMSGAEKDRSIDAFRQGKIKILIATTVVEVGVDVPDATIMVIEHAERFGLSQLHQLRGRVGRSDRPSWCILLYCAPLGEIARSRLSILRESQDGFQIAEEDLRLRGEGEILGTRQSGTPGFQIARPEIHADLLAMARDDARLIVARDPDLESDRGQALRHLLYLFGRDEAIRLLRAG